jgi:hypothetical protein
MLHPQLSGTVPGAVIPARNIYDVSQALSWVATRRNNPEQRVEWQTQIADLIQKLGAAKQKTYRNDRPSVGL